MRIWNCIYIVFEGITGITFKNSKRFVLLRLHILKSYSASQGFTLPLSLLWHYILCMLMLQSLSRGITAASNTQTHLWLYSWSLPIIRARQMEVLLTTMFRHSLKYWPIEVLCATQCDSESAAFKNTCSGCLSLSEFIPVHIVAFKLDQHRHIVLVFF